MQINCTSDAQKNQSILSFQHRPWEKLAFGRVPFVGRQRHVIVASLFRDYLFRRLVMCTNACVVYSLNQRLLCTSWRPIQPQTNLSSPESREDMKGVDGLHFRVTLFSPHSTFVEPNRIHSRRKEPHLSRFRWCICSTQELQYKFQFRSLLLKISSKHCSFRRMCVYVLVLLSMILLLLTVRLDDVNIIRP